MKNSKFIIIILTLFSGFLSNAQTIAVGGSPLNLPCGGGNVNLTALGNSTVPVFGDNFNAGTVAPGWLASPAAQFNNPCGASMDGTTYLWMGPGTAAPRTMQTAAVNVACGGQVCFDFKFVCELCGDASPCEGADLYNEGVSLQWSTNAGATWTDMAYFAPNGNLLGAYPGAVTSPSASGATAFTTWHNYCFTIPAAAYSASTMFRLRQWGSSGSAYDHWGIDNFYVYATPCTPFYYDWAHIPGAPDAQNVTTNVTSTTTFTCCYTNGTLSACGSVTVNVANMVINTLNFTSPTCLGGSNGTMNVTVTGGTGPYNYVLTGPTNITNTTGVFTGLLAGLYTITIDDATTCIVSQSFTINPGPPCCSVTASATPALCFGQASGTATANPAGGTGPYTFVWYNAGMVPIGQTTQTASGLAAGTYNVTATDALGCMATVAIIVGQPVAALNATATATTVSCFGGCNGVVTVNAPTGGTPAYTYSINGGAYQVSNIFSGKCQGTYTMSVKDNNGCLFPITVTVNQPTDVTLALVSTTPATCGASNGVITVSAAGGTPAYTYTLGASTNATGIFPGQAAGSYTVTVTDANGCTETLPVTVASSAGPVPFIDVQTNVACAGALTGSVTIGVTGGTAPLQYKIDAGAFQASNTFNGVAAGAHVITVQDANGCQGTVNVTITQPTALTFSTVAVAASCNGVCDGQITVNASNATPPYQYSSNNGLTFQPSNILTGLCAGNINVVVKDANGCLANAVVNVTQPTALTSTYGQVDPQCYQTPTGSISFTPAGGTPGYTFSIDNGITFGAANPVTSLMAGVYDVVVQDSHGCLTNSTVTLTDPPAFVFNFIANNPSNCGANDGSFEILAANGLAPYFYSIDGGVTIQVNNGFFGGLFSGLYNLVVSDANGCVDSIYSALSDNIMTTQVDLTVDATCYNSADGLGIVSQQFGAPPFTYLLTPGGISNFSGVFAGLTADTYYVTIQDAGLCIGIQQFTINEPDTITMTLTPTDVTCNLGNDGQISISAPAGGDGGPYTYSIDGIIYQASTLFTGLTAGTYTIFAKDVTGCIGAEQITLLEPVPFNVVINATNLTCFANNSGFVQIVAAGSNTGAYTYQLGVLTNGSGIFAGLAANNYNVLVTDILGCTFTAVQPITEPTELTATYIISDALCNGSCDGEVVVNAVGGTPGYLYSSDGGVTLQSGSTLNGLCAGIHNIYVEDANNCSIVAAQSINDPSLITMAFVTNSATCGLNNGDLTINAANGTPGYTYSNNNGTSFQAANFFAGLPPGNQFVVVKDNNGCVIDSVAIINSDALPVIDNVVATNPLCSGDSNGSISITSSGGVAPHQFSIDGGVTYQASGNFTGLLAGVYACFVQDANLCVETVNITLTDPTLLTYSTVLTDLTCNNNFTGEIDMSASGGTLPYSFSIDNGVTTQGGGTFSFIASGNYNVLVEDGNGCQTGGVEVINEPALLTFTTFTIQNPSCYGVCDGTVTTVTTGGTAPYNYNWSGNIAGSASANASLICDGTYSLIVTDANSCQIDSMNFVLTQPALVPITSVVTTDVLCFGGNTGVITITAPTAVQFSIDGGATFQASNVFSGLTIGNYDIVVESAIGCQAFSNTTVYEPTQVYSLAPSDWFGCFGATVVIQAFSNGGVPPYTYSWTNSLDATVVTTDMFNYTITQASPGVDFTLVVTDANGCIAAPITYNVQSSPSLAISVSDDTTICLGATAVLVAQASGGALIDFGSYLGYSFDWLPGTVSDTLDTYSVSPAVQTLYTVTATDLCGQVVDTTVTVNLFADPIPSVTGGGNGCLPELMSFVNPDYLSGSCFWDFGDGTTSTDCSATDHLYTQTGCFDVSLTLTSVDGCVESASYNDLVCISPLPVPGFYWNPDSPSILDPTIQIINTAENTSFYVYNFGGVGTSFEEQPSFTFPNTGQEETYEICQIVTSPEGCKDTLCQEILIQEEIIFYVPNVFTPDGDPHNQTFKPIVSAGVDMYNYHLTIFNRWGEIIFESFNYDFGWDGTYGSQGLVEDGVYIWQIEFGEKYTDKRQKHRGHVTVLK